MRRLLAAAFAALTLALPAAAQEVVLSGWVLPRGTVVTGVGLREVNLAMTLDSRPDLTFDVVETTEDSVRAVIHDVKGGHIAEIRQTIARNTRRTETRHDGQLVSRTEEEGPLTGATIRVVRRRGVWQRELLQGTPTPEETEELDVHVNYDYPQYPARPVRVGEAWDVDRATMAELFGDLDPAYPSRLTVRLDSVGTYEGGPAAFLTETCDVATLDGEGGRNALRLQTAVVRRTDWRVDVLNVAEGTIRQEVVTPDGRLVVEGRLRHGTRQTVERAEGE